jgi:hypothetical protein
MKTLRGTFVGLAAAAAIVAVPSTGRADVLLPGSIIAGPTTTVFFGGALQATATNTFNNGALAGTARVAVYSGGSGTCAGCLDFYYQFTNTGGAGSTNDAVSRMTGFNYDGGAITTNVFLITNGSLIGAGWVDGTILSQTADRSADGSTVGWVYGTSANSPLLPGFSSLAFVVRTNATQFVTGNYAVIDGVAQNNPAFAPVLPSVVPEPSSMVLVGSGLLALVGMARVRRRK